MKILAVTQARYGSSRLPGKILLQAVDELTFLDIHLERVKKSERIDKLIVATTHEPEADQIAAVSATHGCDVFRGSTTDVLERYYLAAAPHKPDLVVRITSDCPLIDATLIDKCIEKLLDQGLDYVTNSGPSAHFPDGMDVEVMTFEALKNAFEHAKDAYCREHVTPYIAENLGGDNHRRFATSMLTSESDYSNVRLTLDYPEDAALLKRLLQEMGWLAGWLEYAQQVLNDPALFQINNFRNQNLHNE